MPLAALRPTPATDPGLRSAPPDAAGAGWRAHLELGLKATPRRTVLAHRRHQGPLQVQRAFYPETDGTAHLTLLHPPGGVVGGDDLRLTVDLGENTRTLITTPAAGKFYRSAGLLARQTQTLRLARGSQLEWLPQETIVYDGCRAAGITRVELAADARFLGWEMLCLGRPAAHERFTAGQWDQRLELWRDGQPLFLERLRLEGGQPLLDAPWGLHGRPVLATLLCTGADADLAGPARQALEAGFGAVPDTESIGVSQLDQVLVCRYIGDSGRHARAVMMALWRTLRPLLLGKPACAPRIWFT